MSEGSLMSRRIRFAGVLRRERNVSRRLQAELLVI